MFVQISLHRSLGFPQEQLSTSPIDEPLDMTLKRCWAVERFGDPKMTNFFRLMTELSGEFCRAYIWEGVPNMHLKLKKKRMC